MKRPGGRFFPITLGFGMGLCLAGCSGGGTPGNATTDTAAVDDAAIENAAVENVAGPAPDTLPADDASNGTIGGDGSQIRLDPLSSADLTTAKLQGELACSFAQGKSAPILFAMGDVGSAERSQGVVKIAGYVEPVGAPGGFDAMAKGASFAGKGKTIRIAITGPATGGGESPASPATLTYDRADGARRVFAGSWTCGP